ncbi:ubiquitin-protein ligase peroxin 12 [Malassezia cuniculi]|uniref:Peroxisome assembly protein 12 n=1 Tax=Malassezia cuniculi TaxID=948313 RepID=A0AAF0JAJ5_9BASI|nr:ubiquitin-protein ligase peroxin 12 [Malassezia cuniculi]
MDVLSNIDPTSSGGAAADPFRPSFFELMAQEQLASLLKPAIRYVITVVAQRHPRYLLRIVNRFDELYALLMYAVNRHYLRTWNASFTENFYGLARRRRPGVSIDKTASAVSPATLRASQLLTPKQINRSLFILTGLPYIGTKLDEYWEHLGGGVVDDDNDVFGDAQMRTNFDSGVIRGNETYFRRTKRQFEDLYRKYYPYAKVLFQLWMLKYNISYLFGQSPYWRPWLRRLRVDIRRVQGDEQPLVSTASRALPALTQRPGLFAAVLVQKAFSSVFELLKYALPASIFFFKFLEWWYSPSNPRRRGGGGASEGSAQIDPPRVLLPHSRGVVAQHPDTWKKPQVVGKLAEGAADGATRLLHNSCPLCGATPIQNASVLPTGYAFCYTCAHSYVDKWHRCPVTLVPLAGGVEQIRKVLT